MNIRFGILTISDRASSREREDLSGPQLARRLLDEAGWSVSKQEIIPDEESVIRTTLIDWVESGTVDVILTTGGTGFALRDVTPEATRAIIRRDAPGLVEVMRAEGLKKTKHAMLSRAVAGIRNRTLIVNLPGSPQGALENLNTIISVLSHAVQLLKDDPASETSH